MPAWGGVELRFEPDQEHNRAAVRGEGFCLELKWEPFEVQGGQVTGGKEFGFDSSLLWRMKTVWETIFNSSKPNMVNPDPLTGGTGRGDA